MNRGWNLSKDFTWLYKDERSKDRLLQSMKLKYILEHTILAWKLGVNSSNNERNEVTSL